MDRILGSLPPFQSWPWRESEESGCSGIFKIFSGGCVGEYHTDREELSTRRVEVISDPETYFKDVEGGK